MESECSTNWNYKLVAVIKEVINGVHIMAYVKAFRYVNRTGNTEGIHDENGLLRMDNEVIKLINLKEIFKVQPRDQSHFLIYEQFEEQVTVMIFCIGLHRYSKHYCKYMAIVTEFRNI